LFYRVLIEAGRQSRSFGQKLINEKLSMVVFGGGPGTELLGLAKYYLERAKATQNNDQIEVTIDVIDSVSAWSENVSWIKDEIATIYVGQFGKRRDWPVFFDTHAFALNFTDLESFGNLPSIFRRHLPS
jgi:hypothetical protein